MIVLSQNLAAAAGDSRVLPLLLALAILIAAAKALGSLSVSLRQPAVLGELLAGLILGPTLLNLLGAPIFGSLELESAIHELGQLGVIWLMFAAGLEIELRDLRQAGRPALFSGILGVLTPLSLGMLVSRLFGADLQDSIFVGIVLSATSVSISAQTLLELGRLRSREGYALLGAAVIDDILVIMTLSAFVVFAQGEGTTLSVLLNLGQMVLVLGAVSVISLRVLPRLADWSQRLRASEGLLAMTLAGVLLLSWAMEYIGGVAAITGAFIAGVGLRRSHLVHQIEEGIHKIAYAFFVPLFLVDIGIQANARELGGEGLIFALAVIGVAFLSKLLGAGLGARIGGFDSAQSVRLGLGMISRGEVGLIVAGVGLAEGILPPDQFSVIVLMVIVTTMLTPILLRVAYSRQEAPDAPDGDPGN